MTTPKLLPVMEWAKQTMGEHVPTIKTLREWCGVGKIQPQPKKIGRRWFVVPHAEYRE